MQVVLVKLAASVDLLREALHEAKRQKEAAATASLPKEVKWVNGSVKYPGREEQRFPWL